MAAIMTIPTAADKPKRSFEFRMCKKVAELTQVVHMLFTRNHEKEVEMEALKEAYEFELCEVISDAKARIAKLRQEQENMLRQQTGDTDRIRKLLEGDFHGKEEAWRRKLDESDKHLQEERTECQNLRDMLMRAQGDIENLRRGARDQTSSRAEELAKRDREIDRLSKEVHRLEQASKNRDQESGEVIEGLERSKESLEREIGQMHATLEENHRARDQLLVRNKQLEADLKALRRDFNRRVADVVNGQKGHRIGSGLSHSQNEELERLRREIQRYRLELSNRDLNFNRMFTDKQPIHLDRSGTTPNTGAKPQQTSHSAGTVHPSVNGPSNVHPSILKREKTLSGPSSGPMICFQEQDRTPQLPSERQRAMSTPSAHADSRFPSIRSSPDPKPRPHEVKPRVSYNHSNNNNNNHHNTNSSNSNSRLSKPRPLPKEMLFTK